MHQSGVNQPAKSGKSSNPERFKVKLWHLVIPACLVVLCVVGVLASLGKPQPVISRATLVSYEHKGTFDYTAYLKPSSLFGTGSQPTVTPAPVTPTRIPFSSMKYPAESVDFFQFTFNYSFTSPQEIKSVSGRCRVIARGVDAEGKKQDIELLPSTPAEGPQFSLDFKLPMDTKLAGGNIVVDVTVYPTVQLATGPFYESFLHQFTIRRESGMLVIDRVPGTTLNGFLGSYSYTQAGYIQYQVSVKDGNGGNSTLVAPPSTNVPSASPTPSTSTQQLIPAGPGNPVFLKLLEKIDASFSYQLISSSPVTNLTKTASIEADLKAGNIWNKTVTLVPAAPIDKAISFAMDYNGLMKMMDTIREETGASAESYNLVFRAVVQVSGKTSYGDIRETFTPTLTCKTEGGRLTWAEPLQQSKPGKIEKEIVTTSDRRFLGMAAPLALIVSSGLSFIFLMFLIFLIYIYARKSSSPVLSFEKQVRAYQKKYADRITEGVGTLTDSSVPNIEVQSMDDLAKIADEVGKPIIHSLASTGSVVIHRYLVYDIGVNYIYTVKDDGIPK